MQTRPHPQAAPPPTELAIIRTLLRVERAQEATIREVKKGREQVAQKA